jgi:hypothetical protein
VVQAESDYGVYVKYTHPLYRVETFKSLYKKELRRGVSL